MGRPAVALLPRCVVELPALARENAIAAAGSVGHTGFHHRLQPLPHFLVEIAVTALSCRKPRHKPNCALRGGHASKSQEN
jgi:hypothetical protein